MIDLWYWQTQGKQHGPLSTEELEKLILRHRVTETDEFRVAGTSDWLPAADIKAMFAEATPPSSAANASEMASQVLSQRDRMQLEAHQEDTSRAALTAHLLAQAVRAGVRAVSALIATFRDAVSFALEKVLWLLLRKATIVAVIFAVLVALILNGLCFDESRDEEIHTDLATAWDELKALQDEGASEAELKQFAAETREWLDPTLAELQRSATDEFRVNPSQFGVSAHLDAAEAQAALLQAGRAFKELVEGSAMDKQRVGMVFAHGMKRSREYLSGELHHGDGRSTRSRMQARDAKRLAPGSEKTTSRVPLIIGMALVNMGVLATLFFWWRRRRRTPSGAVA
jgi:hypothetical protein